MISGPFPVLFLLGCLLAGLMGAAAGAWWCTRRVCLALRSQLRLALHELLPLPIEPQRPVGLPDRDAQFIQAVRQAIQIEFESQERQLAERDRARVEEQRRWQTDHDERSEQELRAALQVLSAASTKSADPRASTAASARHHGPSNAPSPAPAVSARPPELIHTPLPRPQPAYVPEEPVFELSDEEIDALPAEIPAPDRARKRLLPAPRKPEMRGL